MQYRFAIWAYFGKGIMEKLSNEDKMKLGHEAFKAFLEPFQPLDYNSKIFVDVLCELLMQKPFLARLSDEKFVNGKSS